MRLWYGVEGCLRSSARRLSLAFGPEARHSALAVGTSGSRENLLVEEPQSADQRHDKILAGRRRGDEAHHGSG